MAIATSITASAAVSTVEKKAVVAEKMNTAVQVLDYSRVENNNGMLKAPAKPDLNNYYGFTYYGRTKEDSQTLQTYAIQLKQVSETKVLIYGLFCPVIDFPVEATYDASQMTLTIKPQVVVPADVWGELSGNNESINLYCRELVVADNQITGEKELPSITFQYGPEGFEMQDGSIKYVGAWVPESSLQELVFNVESNLGGNNGFLGGWKYGNIFPALEDLYPAAPAFTFDPSEWTNVGNSKFTDGWFYVFSESEVPAYDVVTYENKANKNLYLLENPYGANSPYASINGSPNDKGYIMLNVENPECVLVRPNIPSGMDSYKLTGIKSTLTCTSDEGVRFYIDEYTYEDIIDEAQSFEVPLPTMSKDRVVTLPNCGFQYITNLIETDKWVNNEKEPLPMVTTIVLPSAGVEGVINDAENVAKRYFNLQGVEIANPEAGQIVIVKEGNKATKTIVR